MASAALRKEEKFGLALALAAHAGLVLLLVLRPPTAPIIPTPERMTVTLSDTVGLTSTSPEPAADAAPDFAPAIGEQPEPEPQPSPPPSEPLPQPKPEPRVAPAPPQPVARATPKPATRPAPAPVAKASAPPERRPAGGSRIGNDFLKGVAGAEATGSSRNPPAAAIGPAVRSSIGQAISRQLKPHWVAPQGADAELLVTIVRFRLARDGSLIGDPEIVSQSGDTDANFPQKKRHAEQAIRAVRLASPFDLPEEYYSAWQVVTSQFDKRLSR